MKNIFKTFGLHLGVFSVFVLSFGIAYAAWDTAVNTGDQLTASSWNALVGKVKTIDSNIAFSNGKVGIGTSTPTGILHVSSPAAGLTVQDSDASINTPGHTAVVSFTDNSNSLVGYVGYNTSGESLALINNNDDGNIEIGNSGAQMLIKNNGNVGIGTLNPQAKLEVTGVLHDKIALKTGSNTAGDRSHIKFVNNSDVLTGYIASGVDRSVAMYNGVGQGIHIDASGATRIWSLAGSYSGGSAFVCVNNSGVIYASETACP